jgi:uncharacterized membrane protein YphA (DoxX/SURF4 family)
MKILLTIIRFAVEGILLQTLYFKFSASAESVYIFSTLGLEPYGRIGIGVGELIAAALLISGMWRHFGAAIAMGLMAGAIMSHLGPLGIEVMNDGGELFILALLVFVGSGIIMWVDRQKFFDLLSLLKKGAN